MNWFSVIKRWNGSSLSCSCLIFKSLASITSPPFKLIVSSKLSLINLIELLISVCELSSFCIAIAVSSAAFCALALSAFQSQNKNMAAQSKRINNKFLCCSIWFNLKGDYLRFFGTGSKPPGFNG